MKRQQSLCATFAACLVLTGCATVEPGAGAARVRDLVAQAAPVGPAGFTVMSPEDSARVIADLLSRPLDADAAVRIALLNNPGLHAALAALAVSDADVAQAGRLSNPHLTLGRFRAGDEVEIERMIKFDVLGLILLPWRREWAGQQAALARLDAAQQVVRLAAQTRKAWVRAVAAQQSLAYHADVKEAADAGEELARRLAAVGNWSRLAHAREQTYRVDAMAQLARAQQAAVATREELVRLLGLWGAQTAFNLPARLPDLPAQLPEARDIEAQALSLRLDVRAARAQADAVGQSLGVRRAAEVLDSVQLGVAHTSVFDNAAGTHTTKRGFELEFALPLLDQGQARDARARSLIEQSNARLKQAAVTARSEAREAWHGWRTAHDLARHYRDEAVPLRRLIQDETLLRYNGMLVSVFDLLAQARNHVLTVNASIDALRDFWLADIELGTALTGTSPLGLSAGAGAAAQGLTEPAGH